jgi:lipoprotein-anchoring transpeptidase ErfK/SrfK
MVIDARTNEVTPLLLMGRSTVCGHVWDDAAMRPRPRFALLALAALALAVVLGRAGNPGGMSQTAAPVAALATQPAPLFADAQVGAGDDGGSEQIGVEPAQQDVLPGPGAWIARSAAARLRVWSRPGGDVGSTLDTHNPWDQQLAFPIVRAMRAPNGVAWYRIMLGIEPNGSTGWIRASEATIERSTDRIVVDLSAHTLRLIRGGELTHRFRVGVGASNTLTTSGRFFVWASLLPSDASGPYGAYLLGLSGFSDVLQSWPGGGRLAIHGTDDATDRGHDVSHGCVRVFNPQMNRLRDVPMGTVVVIHP